MTNNQTIKNTIFLRAFGLIAGCALILAVTVSTASAATLMMPDRETLSFDPVVVWGNTTEGAGPVTISFGDGSPDETPAFNINSQSYIATTHTYTTALTSETFTATLTVGGSMASVDITVIDGLALTPSQLEDQQTNNAIEDGLRYQYFSVDSREVRHDAGWVIASWQGHGAFTSMATLAFENHGHTTISGDIYSPVVQGGLNYVFNGLSAIGLGAEPAGDPCVGGIPSPCHGLVPVGAGAIGYSTSIALLAISGSQTPAAIVGAGLGAGSGQSYLEVAQRLANTVAWGQADPGTSGRGGWQYGLDNGASDGSAIGWNVLGLFDAAAFGATVPAFVAAELEYVIADTTNATGSMGYAVANSIPNTAKTGVRLTALSLIGVPLGGTTALTMVTPQKSVDYINDGWNIAGTCVWGSTHPSGGLVNGKNCIYSMYNVFKGLKLYGVTTLPNVPRPDNDWHKDYQSYLVSIQTSPNITTGGSFSTLEAFGFGTQGETALALLVLSPVALVLPDPVRFADIGLQHDPWSDPAGSSEAENLLGVNHTVTARTLSVAGTPVPGTSVDFTVTAGPSSVATICAGVVTDSDGFADCTYTSAVAGTDTIEATVGAIVSNTVNKTWIPLNFPPVADANGPYAGDEGSSIGLDATGSSDPDGDTVTYLWTTIDGSGVCDDLTSATPNCVWPDNGAYSVCVTVDDGNGETDVNCSTATIANVAPDVGPISVTLGLLPINDPVCASADFTDDGTADTHTADWDWGDSCFTTFHYSL